MSITILGLGPGDPELLTRKAWRILSEGTEIFLRTARHPGVEALPSSVYHSFDDLYDKAQDFDSLYQQIAEQVVALGKRDQGVIYAVPGHPLVGESTVTRILALAQTQQMAVEIVDGLSFIEPTLDALQLDALGGVQIHDAVDIANMHHPPLNPDLPALLAQVYSLSVASDVKLTLSNQYPDEHPVTLVHAAGTPAQVIEQVPLYAIDHSEHISHLTSLYVPPLTQAGSFERFQEVMAHLRAPEGCPWDRKQDHLTLRRYLIEETYEVLDALDNEDMDSLQEELGDLLLQIVFHAQIATEAGDFRMADVLNYVITKMIKRHPHVWGDVQVNDADDVLRNWEKLKQQEKAEHAEPEAIKSVFDGVPNSLPALAQASAYHERAARTGFDWTDVQQVIEKLHEEIDEVLRATNDAERKDEIGDMLTVVVNIARWLKVDPETALRDSNRKFKRRFQFIEQHAGRPVNELTFDQMEELWAQAKAEERKGQ
ncbi:MAG: nucleoside triphosphate pyrophosphohydrolase [Anaerolineae bacterium]|nr:nucleoside triphosphate pyrophosphohydrolase [Anaerolineae bacterium]